MYILALTAQARKDRAKIPEPIRERVDRALDALRRDPFQGKSLQGDLKGARSIRVWPYRIVYQMYRRELVVIVIGIPNRKDAYR